MKKIVLLILSEPHTYPPTINAANILNENGWEVLILGIRYKTTDYIKLNSGIQLKYIDKHRKGLANFIQYLFYFPWSLSQCFLFNPKVILSYDSMSVGPAFLISKSFKIKWFYHIHDLLGNVQGWYKIIELIEKKFAHRANTISIPQKERAELYKNYLKKDIKIDVVFNGPRKKWIKNYKSNLIMQSLKQKFEKIIIYQGGLSTHFNLEIMLEAMKFSKSEFAFCIIGRELEVGIKKRFELLIKRFSLEERVFILNPLGYDDLASITSLADIGIAKLTNDNNAPINDYYLIGASNKNAEYSAAGLPIIFPNTEINKAYLEEYPIGVTCNTNSAIDLAKTIDHLFENIKYYEYLSLLSRETYLEKLNFDTQFETLLKKIENNDNISCR